MASHRGVALLSALCLLFGGLLGHAPAAHAVGAWTPAAPPSPYRGQEAPALLPDGRVLFTGGTEVPATPSSLRTLNAAQVYDAATNTWSSVAPLAVARTSQRAVTLRDGTVLVVGGTTGSGVGVSVCAFAATEAERYDPRANRWSSAGTLAYARCGHTATPLPDGRVLLVGGKTGPNVGDVFPPAEVYDLVTNAWTTTANLATPRQGHRATLLGDGRVLVTGGYDASFRPLATAEVYAPATGRWTPAGTMGTSRIGYTATLLPTGQVLVAGGQDASFAYLSSTELYDPRQNAWTPAAPLSVPRVSYAATLLADGTLLVVGGVTNKPGTTYGGASLATAELYDPARNVWAGAAPMSAPRSRPAATVLPDGQVFVVGEGSAELYTSRPEPAGCFAETGTCVRPPFLGYWLAHGGLARNGLPLSDEFIEVLEDGRAYQVQYFERVRLEYHRDSGGQTIVLLGHFGRRILLTTTGREVEPPAEPLPGQAYFAETGHNLADGFLDYWVNNGGLMQFGFPISEVFEQQLEDGQVYRVQYFERARFEYRPENPPPWDILLGHFGRRILAQVELLSGRFGALYTTDERVRGLLGAPAAPAVQVQGATQEFERGRMLSYREREGGVGLISVLCGEPQAGRVFTTSRLTLSYLDPWDPSQPVGGGPGPRPGLYESQRGFGKVWREGVLWLPDPSGYRATRVQDRLGYALTADEIGYPVMVQEFERGVLLSSAEGRFIYVVYFQWYRNFGLAGSYTRHEDRSP